MQIGDTLPFRNVRKSTWPLFCATFPLVRDLLFLTTSPGHPQDAAGSDLLAGGSKAARASNFPNGMDVLTKPATRN